MSKECTYILLLIHRLLLSLPWSRTQSAKSFLFACVKKKRQPTSPESLCPWHIRVDLNLHLLFHWSPGKPTLISTKPSLSSNPWNGPPPRLSLSAFPAHTLQIIGLSSSAPRTSPTHIKTTERMVSIEMSSGRPTEGWGEMA